MFDFINKKICHIINLILLASASKHTKCAPLSNQKFTTQPTLINLHPNEYTQGLRHYPFTVSLDKCVGCCDNLNDL